MKKKYILYATTKNMYYTIIICLVYLNNSKSYEVKSRYSKARAKKRIDRKITFASHVDIE